MSPRSMPKGQGQVRMKTVISKVVSKTQGINKVGELVNSIILETGLRLTARPDVDDTRINTANCFEYYDIVEVGADVEVRYEMNKGERLVKHIKISKGNNTFSCISRDQVRKDMNIFEGIDTVS